MDVVERAQGGEATPRTGPEPSTSGTEAGRAMRFLVLGAGALGTYFGGRLLEAGRAAEVAFVVRPGRGEQLSRGGLVIESPAGDFRLGSPRTISADNLSADWDVVLLACKAYDLDDAIATLRPAVGERTAILPLLNGVAHLDRLQAEFGRDRVLGGLSNVAVALAPDGSARQLTKLQQIEFGELDGTMTSRVRAIAAAFAGTPVQAEAVPDIRQRMWEKLVIFGTLAAANLLTRANLGEVVSAPGGLAWLERLLHRNAAIAAAHGYPVRPQIMQDLYLPFLRTMPQATTSMLRDLEAGKRIEADHVLGFLLEAARRVDLPDELHEAAYLNAKAYEARRDAGRLPPAAS